MWKERSVSYYRAGRDKVAQDSKTEETESGGGGPCKTGRVGCTWVPLKRSPRS